MSRILLATCFLVGLGLCFVHPALATVGGPDSFGYEFLDNEEAAGPAFLWEDISASGSVSSTSNCDDCTEQDIPLGFDFNFYGTDFTTSSISSNGFVALGSQGNNGCCIGASFPDSGGPNNIIGVWWEDLDPADGGTIYYETLGSAPNRYFIVQYENVVHYPNGNPVQVQVKLFEGLNSIEVHLLNPAADAGTHSVGIENDDGTIGLQYHRGGALAANTAVRFGSCTSLDVDGDGFTECGGDCDDFDPLFSPGRIESCDGQDNDCDGLIDEVFDLDMDGYTTCGDDLIPGTADDDCNDGDDMVNPGQMELCNGLDDDCQDPDGAADEFLDQDNDSWQGCQECNDNDPTINPNAAEACDAIDNDCDRLVDEDFDTDDDGVPTCGADGVFATADDDCDDMDATVAPGAPELCDGLDNDCNGSADFPDELVNQDADDYPSCSDCDDSRSTSFPGAPEVCDDVDQDCDGLADNGFDMDADGFTSCGADGVPGAGGDDDCDDGNSIVYPGAPELCDGLDNDCVNGADFAGETVDADTDGSLACADCDDNEPLSVPGATEVCDFVDNDCDSGVDEGFDLDGDGYLVCEGDCVDDPNLASAASINPGVAEVPYDGLDNDCLGGDMCDVDGDGYFAEVQFCLGGDCDDAEAGINPDAQEICGGVDEDCNGSLSLQEQDLDFDGVTGCDGDCDNLNADRSPEIAEVCDNRDNDCDGLIDEDFDQDGDGVVSICGPVRDCNDENANIGPGFPEVCDGLDNDCDLLIDNDPACDSGQCGFVAGGNRGAPWLGLLLFAAVLRVRRVGSRRDATRSFSEESPL